MRCFLVRPSSVRGLAKNGEHDTTATSISWTISRSRFELTPQNAALGNAGGASAVINKWKFDVNSDPVFVIW